MEKSKSAHDCQHNRLDTSHRLVTSEKSVAYDVERKRYDVLGDENAEYDYIFYERWRRNVTTTLLCAALVVTGFFCLQLRPQIASISSKHTNPPPRLVRYSTIAAATTTTSGPAVAATTGLTVDFGVYQPVLLPGGAVDQTIANDGTRSTGIISAISDNGTCATILLMDHSFGQSYGAPYVGELNQLQMPFNI